ncbi:MAG: SRPBCC domain-containing protein [Leptospiraceae bacterium]|nr:SRPBCC domain-containing protein [Leptospiraceae bacterium]
MENVDKEIFSSRIFNAPRDLVWEVWTNPKHTALWWGPNGFTNIIIYIEVVKPERLVYNHGNYENPNMFFVTINFLEDNGKTKITMRMLFNTREEREVVVEKYGALEGQKQHLDKLDAYLAQQIKEGKN